MIRRNRNSLPFIVNANDVVMDNSQGAPGLLASTLLSAAKLQAKNVLPPVSSGCAVIDEQALNGGFRHGEIISIAGASSSGKTTVCATFGCGKSHRTFHI